MTPELSQRLTLLHHLVQYGNQLLVVADLPGAGKTRLLELVVSQASTRWRIARLCAKEASEQNELLNEMLERFALPSSGDGSKERLDALESGLKSIDARGQIALVIVDDAHALTHEALQMVADLACRRHEIGACFLLLGRPPLLSKLHELTVKGVLENCIYTLEVPPLSENESTNRDYLLAGRRPKSTENGVLSRFLRTPPGHAGTAPRKLDALVAKTGSPGGRRGRRTPRADVVARSSTWWVISSLAVALVGLSVLLFTGETSPPNVAKRIDSTPSNLAWVMDGADTRVRPPEATVASPSPSSAAANHQESLPSIDLSIDGSHARRSDSRSGDENRTSTDAPAPAAEVKPARKRRNELRHEGPQVSMVTHAIAPTTLEKHEPSARTEQFQSTPETFATAPLMMLGALNDRSPRDALLEPLVDDLPDVVTERNEPYGERLSAEEFPEAEVGNVLAKDLDHLSEADERSIADQTAEIARTFKEEIVAGELNVEVTQGSIVIQIRDKAFPSGSADVTEHFTPVIEKISDILLEMPGEVIIAGHTDNIAISTEQFRSNWELSVARSMTVLHHLLGANVFDPSRFLVQGHGDSKPLVPNDTSENRALNRRVEVILVPGGDATTSAHVDSRIERQG